MNESDLFGAAERALLASQPDEKVRATLEAARAWQAGRLVLNPDAGAPILRQPGRPERLALVQPKGLPSRGHASAEGRAALFHAVVHIEFSAIDLAWDAVYRFRDLPRPYYDDWVRIAAEEAYHFCLLRQHLRSLGHDYGDFPAHDGLWQTALETADDNMARMALVPRCLEARGLDVNPGMKAKLQGYDPRGAMLLDIILADEIGHVAAGNRWFHYHCRQRGLDPVETYFSLLHRHLKRLPRGPLYRTGRLAAGFTEEELARLEQEAGSAGEAP